MKTMLKVDHATISYKIGDFKDIGLKEWTMRHLKNNYHVETFTAVNDVSFDLLEGDLLGIIGSNGAGKSTLLKAITGVMEPRSGHIERNGRIVALLELASGFDGDLTVKENAYLRGAMLGYTRGFMDKTFQQILDFSELWDFADRPFKQLSTGMQSRLAFSIASLVQPEILILDEVLSVGDGAFQEKSAKKMREIIEGGAATILVSHSLGQIKELCNKVIWLDHGHQIRFGEAEPVCDAYEAFLSQGGNAVEYVNWQPQPEEKQTAEVREEESKEPEPLAGQEPVPVSAAEPEPLVGQEPESAQTPIEPVPVGRITREDVINCYRFLLGREPESEEVICDCMESYRDLHELRRCFLRSDEFQAIYSANTQYDTRDNVKRTEKQILDTPGFIEELDARLLRKERLWGDPARLDIHPSVVLNDALLNTNCGLIHIGADSFAGHRVSILTDYHYVDRKLDRRKDYPKEGRDIVIGKGVWLASGCMVIGPCVIGDHAVVSEGAVVTPGTEIPAGTLWGGNPAQQLRALVFEDFPEESCETEK